MNDTCGWCCEWCNGTKALRATTVFGAEVDAPCPRCTGQDQTQQGPTPAPVPFHSILADMREGENLMAYAARLKRGQDELASHVERLREALSESLEYADDHPGMPPTAEYHKALEETPAQSLAAVRAEAVEKAVHLYTHKWKEEFRDVAVDIMREKGGYIHPNGLREYAKQLRNGSDDDE